ncbi:penicillin-binding protein 1A [Alkalihalobacillus sp. AL-G]|uniref:penicillin-binding protein 1A n=1 Tax=Alkalihalobacillus sp. AL-G TaxID=2926399 RepID=UPI00272DB7F0|nr:penicillin-binding protein 1A [Alkalihalobacillus sp. AL-G]WLD91787.1 PBP1A family penicillin-binding protein [Alkalihalobacillus sp. AL-G]
MNNNYKSRQERRHQANPKNNKKKPPNSKKGILKKVTALLLVFGLIGITAGAIAVFAIISNAPELNPKALETPVASKLYDMNGDEYGMLYSDEKRIRANLSDIPEVVQNSFVAVEDVRFYDHFGIDIRRIGGAVIANITEGFGAEGGSTITQQVIKNTLLTNDKKITRKIKEAYLAIKLEQRYSKDQILEMYLNKIYFGQSAWGVATAAETYFGKEISELKLHEAALLAGLPKAPSYYDPFENPEGAEERRNIVLSQMEKYGYITKEQYEKAKSIPVTEYVKKPDPEKQNDPYNTFEAQVMEEAAKMAGFDDPGKVKSAGLEIYTTLNPKAQDAVEEALYTDTIIAQKNIKGGLVLMDTQTGAVRAIGSGRKNQMSSYYATQLKRQPGSTIKPILDYGPAIEHMQWPTYKQVSDEDIVINGHEFHNYDNENHGTMSIRRALYESYNLPAIHTWQDVGADKAEEFAEKLGIEIDDKHYSPSYAIGGFREGPSPMELAAAYAAFGNEGVYNEPFTVTKIKFPDGRVIEKKSNPEVVMEEYTAYMITDMLKDVMTIGTARDVNLNFPVAGKTGTTNYGSEVPEIEGETKDAWFAGYSTELTAAIWTGFDSYEDKEGNFQYLTGKTDDYSKQIFEYVMERASKDLKNADWKRPKSVVEVPIEKGTGKRASEFTPDDQIRMELAVEGTDLPKVSEKYFKVETPKDFKAKYDKKKHEVKLSWKYPKELLDKGITFKVLYSMDGAGYQELTSQSEMELVVQNIAPGTTYNFQVVAVDQGRNKESDPATVQVKTEKEKDSLPDLPGDGDGEGDDDGNGNGGGNGGTDGTDGGEGGTGDGTGDGTGTGETGGTGDDGGTTPPSGSGLLPPSGREES